MSILKHESDIWATADLLRGAGIKTSDFPKYMMPFFALLMVESRLIRESKRMVDDGESKDNMDDFVEIFQLEGLGYNDFVIRQGKSLKDICKNDKTFDVDYHSYIKSFDAETKYLLGVDKGTEEEKFLDRLDDTEYTFVIYEAEKYIDYFEATAGTESNNGQPICALWDSFGELSDVLPSSFFPAYVLLKQPGLIHHQEACAQLESRASQAMIHLLQCRLGNENEISAREKLQAVSPALLRLYLELKFRGSGEE